MFKTKVREQKILVIISIILLVLIIFSASFFMVFFDRSFYDKEFKKYGQYDELGTIGVQNTIDYLIKYLTSQTTEINEVKELAIFMPEERVHLEDVRNIIRAVKVVGIVSFVLLIGAIIWLNRLKGFKPNLRKILVYSSISALAVLAILFVLSLNFPAFFESFHKILFPQGNYSFPSYYLLIKLFPEAFFNEFAKKMLFHVLIISLILLTLGTSPALAFSNPRRH
ncbi:MAG TPA: DUF1461 domain-containing protein [Candidatus Nanoarchaeia archaeon]|nr:DUF1461 domain-containing protein [Candidatus Nanoarchaeia archaeon]